MSLSEEPGRAGETGFARAFRRVLAVDLAICELVLIAMMVLVALELLLRNAFGVSLRIADEYAGYALVVITFLGISVSLQDGRVFRVEVLSRYVPVRAWRVLQVLMDIVALGFTALMMEGACRQVISSYTRGISSPSGAETPLFLPQAVMPAGLLLLGVVLLLRLIQDIRRLRIPEESRESAR